MYCVVHHWERVWVVIDESLLRFGKLGFNVSLAGFDSILQELERFIGSVGFLMQGLLGCLSLLRSIQLREVDMRILLL